jgi:hypothetical protein
LELGHRFLLEVTGLGEELLEPVQDDPDLDVGQPALPALLSFIILGQKPLNILQGDPLSDLSIPGQFLFESVQFLRSDLDMVLVEEIRPPFLKIGR